MARNGVGRATRLGLALAGGVLWLAVASFAQHGTAPPGYYPAGYGADVWAGELTAYDPATYQLTLTFWRCLQPDQFTAVLVPPETSTATFQATDGGGQSSLTGYWLVAKSADGKPELRMGKFRNDPATLPIGSRLLIFYIGRKVQGQKQNQVFALGFLAPLADLHTITGHLVRVVPETGELIFSTAANQLWSGYLQPGYYIRPNHGPSRLLRPDDLPIGIPFKIEYRKDKCALGGRKKDSVHWIYQLILATRPRLSQR